MVAWTYQHASKTLDGMPHARASFYFDMGGALTLWDTKSTYGKLNYDIQGTLAGGTSVNPMMADMLGNPMSNNNVITSKELELSTLVWEQRIEDGYIFRVGKFLDPAHFDENAIADNSVTGFMSQNFNQSITNPFPGYGFGVNLEFSLDEATTITLGTVNSEPHGVHTSGIAGMSWDHLLTTAQITLTKNPEINGAERLGNYRFLVWNNGIENPNGPGNIDGWGGLFNFDQELTDSCTIFARIGWCDENVTVSDFSVSGGFQIELDELSDSTMGLAYQYAEMSAGGLQKFAEWYYRTRWSDSNLYIGPVVQYYDDVNIKGSVILGFRSTLSF